MGGGGGGVEGGGGEGGGSGGGDGGGETICRSMCGWSTPLTQSRYTCDATSNNWPSSQLLASSLPPLCAVITLATSSIVAASGQMLVVALSAHVMSVSLGKSPP